MKEINVCPCKNCLLPVKYYEAKFFVDVIENQGFILLDKRHYDDAMSLVLRQEELGRLVRARVKLVAEQLEKMFSKIMEGGIMESKIEIAIRRIEEKIKAVRKAATYVVDGVTGVSQCEGYQLIGLEQALEILKEVDSGAQNKT